MLSDMNVTYSPQTMMAATEPIFEYQFRVIVLGDSTVGKSSLLKYFTEGKFDETCEPTVGVDFFARLVEIQPSVRIKLQLWDTAGQERFRSITRSYYRNSVGAILVYDITKRSTFEHLEDWLEELRIHILPRQAVYAIVGHKSDMADTQRVVTQAEGRRFAAKHGGLHFMETSAKTGENVEELLTVVARDIYSMVQRGLVELDDDWDGVKAADSPGNCLRLRFPGSNVASNDTCC